MVIYFLMAVTVILAGVAGLQFFYMGFLEKQTKEQKRRISTLEKHTRQMALRLTDAEETLVRQSEMIQSFEFYDEEDEIIAAHEDEVWADVIEES